MRTTAAPLVAGVVLVGALGTVHGLNSDRWGPSGQLERAIHSLDRVPGTFGDWVGEDTPYEPEDMARAGIRGTVLRRYQNPRTREAVSLLIVCGRGGPICVHTPDVCYAGAGFKEVGADRPADLDLGVNGTHAFRVIRFTKTDALTPSQLEIYWSWSVDGRTWQAPANPRMSLARSQALYKMYVVREFIPGTKSESSDACKSFLTQALPDIREQLPAGQ